MSQNLQAELDAILHHAAVASLDDRAFLRVTGGDATRWLNGMVTNSVQALAPGEGCYNFLLNAQGRILGDCTIYREGGDPPSYLLETTCAQVQFIQQHLDHFIIMDDVELKSVQNYSVIVLIGPAAAALLDARDISSDDLNLGEFAHVTWVTYSLQFDVLRSPNPSLPKYEIRGEASAVLKLQSLLSGAGAVEVSPEALEALRLLEARPLYGRDITERYLPQETNQAHALHFNKGCYLGQEIVERIRSRGQVHRLLTPLTLTGSLPTELPTPIEADGKSVGEITSATVVPLPEGDQLLALGYVRRDALDTHAALTYSGGGAVPRTASKELLTTSH